jgi:hypothetical protein
MLLQQSEIVMDSDQVESLQRRIEVRIGPGRTKLKGTDGVGPAGDR